MGRLPIWFAPWKSACPLQITVEFGGVLVWIDLNAWGLYAIFGAHAEIACGPVGVAVTVRGKDSYATRQEGDGAERAEVQKLARQEPIPRPTPGARR